MGQPISEEDITAFKKLLEEQGITTIYNGRSIKKIHNAWDNFSKWSASCNIEPLKASKDNIVAYIIQLLQQGSKLGSIKYSISVLKKILKLSNEDKEAIHSTFKLIWLPKVKKDHGELDANILTFKNLLEQQGVKVNNNQHLKKLYKNWEGFSSWCVSYNIEPLQANGMHLTNYLSYLIKTGIKLKMIMRSINSIIKSLKYLMKKERRSVIYLRCLQA